MWRFIVVIAIVIGVIGLVSRKKSDSPSVAAEVSGHRYSESRMAFNITGREIEMVVVAENPRAEECSGQTGGAVAKKICPGNGKCKVISFECTNELTPRYSKMLEQKPVSLPYAHFVLTRDGREEKAALVSWGMTVAESRSMCQGMSQLVKKEMGDDQRLVISCIDSNG